MDQLGLLSVQGTLKSLLQHHSSKASILQCSAFLIVQLSHPYMTTGKTIALTRWTFVGTRKKAWGKMVLQRWCLFQKVKKKVQYLHSSDFKWLKRTYKVFFHPCPMAMQYSAPEITNINSLSCILPKMFYAYDCKMYVVGIIFVHKNFVSQWKHTIPLWEMQQSSSDYKSSLLGFKSQFYHILSAHLPIKLFDLCLPQFPLMQDTDYH